jgi:hypothetical protein
LCSFTPLERPGYGLFGCHIVTGPLLVMSGQLRRAIYEEKSMTFYEISLFINAIAHLIVSLAEFSKAIRSRRLSRRR